MIGLPVKGKENNTIKLLNNSCNYHTCELVSCGQIHLFPTANIFVQYCFYEAGTAWTIANRKFQPLAQWGISKTRLERVSAGKSVGGDTGCDLPRPLRYAAKMGGLRKAGQRPGLSGRGGFPGGRSAAGRPGQRPAAGTNHHFIPAHRSTTAALHLRLYPVYSGSINRDLSLKPVGVFCI